MTSKTNFRKELQVLLREKKISIAKLARMVDLNSSTLYKYFQGTSELRADNLAKVFDALQSL